MPRPRAATVAVVAAVAAVGLLPFFWSTTFFTDDHLLLAFARYAPNPLIAFVRDEHGGEFYRPFSMNLWWSLARIGHGTIWPYAIVGASLHLLVAAQVAWLLRALGGSRAAAASAAVFFWLSPETREAALWAAAFPDWLGSALVLGSLLALLRARRAAAIALATCAYLTKESAIILPALAWLVLAVRERGLRASLRAGWRDLALLTAPALAYLLLRRHVLGGWGGSGDERASFTGKLIQVSSGVVHVVAGSDIFPEAFAWGAGVAVLAVAMLAALRRARAGESRAWLGIGFAGIAVLPLFAAGWIIGARYFYLPAVGLAWLVGEAAGAAAPPGASPAWSCCWRWARSRRRSATTTCGSTTAASRRRAARSPTASRTATSFFTSPPASRTWTWRSRNRPSSATSRIGCSCSATFRPRSWRCPTHWVPAPIS